MQLGYKKFKLLGVSLTLVAFLIFMNIMSRDYAVLWTFALVPIMIIVTAFPTWKAANGIILPLVAIKYFVIFGIHQVTPEESLLREHIVASIVNLTVAYLFTVLRIQMRHMKEELMELTVVDPLTGIHNRRYLDISIEKALDRATRGKLKLFGIIIDINNFKCINDKHGHHLGDEVLRVVATAIQNEVRYGDDVVRLGGDEFGVLLYDVEKDTASEIMIRIHEAIMKAEVLHINTRIQVKASLGGSFYSPGESRKQFAGRVDRAMYKAKQSGNKIFIL